MPILMLTARDAVEDRITGLDHGADDYSPNRSNSASCSRASARCFAAPVNFALPRFLLLISSWILARKRFPGRASVALTAKEYALLEYLARNAGRVVGRAEIAEHVWDETFDPFRTDRSLRQPRAPQN